MNPPFHFLEQQTRNRWMKITLVVALGMTVLMNVLGRPLKTEAASGGIISFEFAGSVANAQAMMASWGEAGRLRAALGLGLDFLYPLVYATAISLGCVWATERIRPSRPQLANLGIWLAWGAWLAALLDYVENISLIQMLLGSSSEFWPLLAFGCAAVKFILIIIGILYILVAWLTFR
jgi:hypothetical protein